MYVFSVSCFLLTKVFMETVVAVGLPPIQVNQGNACCNGCCMCDCVCVCSMICLHCSYNEVFKDLVLMSNLYL